MPVRTTVTLTWGQTIAPMSLPWPYDEIVRPHATKSFCKVKAKIPKILSELGLPAYREEFRLGKAPGAWEFRAQAGQL